MNVDGKAYELTILKYLLNNIIKTSNNIIKNSTHSFD